MIVSSTLGPVLWLLGSWWFLSPAYCWSPKQCRDAACLKSWWLQGSRSHPLGLQQRGRNLSWSPEMVERDCRTRGAGRACTYHTGKWRLPWWWRQGDGDVLAPRGQLLLHLQICTYTTGSLPWKPRPWRPCNCQVQAEQLNAVGSSLLPTWPAIQGGAQLAGDLNPGH